MNELIGTSYFYLKKYFGNAITEFDGPYLDYLPKDIPPPYEPMAPEVPDGDIKEPDIEGSQAPGKQILVNKKGEEIASMTFTELPTTYSVNKNNSVGLEIGAILIPTVKDGNTMSQPLEKPEEEEKPVVEKPEEEEEKPVQDNTQAAPVFKRQVVAAKPPNDFLSDLTANLPKRIDGGTK